jgi:hypothetical protein
LVVLKKAFQIMLLPAVLGHHPLMQESKKRVRDVLTNQHAHQDLE